MSKIFERLGKLITKIRYHRYIEGSKYTAASTITAANNVGDTVILNKG